MRTTILLVIGIIIILGVASFFYFTPKEQTEDFSLDQLFIRDVLTSNNFVNNSVVVTNLAVSEQNFKIKVAGIEDFVTLDKNEFNLASKDSQKVNVIFSNKNSKDFGIYSGFIEVSSNNQQKRIPVTIEVQSEDILFGANVDVFPRGKLYPGDKINLEIKIFDLSNIGEANIELNYFIKDFNGNTLFTEKEISSLKAPTTVTKAIELPRDMSVDDYLFGAILKYKNSVSTSSSVFKIIERENKLLSFIGDYKYLLVVAVVFIVVLVVLLITNKQSKNLEKIMKQQSKEVKHIQQRVKKAKIDGKEAAELKQKLNIQLGALENAYREGYIKKEAYEKGKQRIQNLAKKLKEKCL